MPTPATPRMAMTQPLASIPARALTANAVAGPMMAARIGMTKLGMLGSAFLNSITTKGTPAAMSGIPTELMNSSIAFSLSGEHLGEPHGPAEAGDERSRQHVPGRRPAHQQGREAPDADGPADVDSEGERPPAHWQSPVPGSRGRVPLQL